MISDDDGDRCDRPAAAGPAGEGRLFEMVEPMDLVRQIARRIRDAIIKGVLKPGQRLNELQLSRDFGTSRGPIREAARLLESQGLIQSNPRRGFSVRALAADDLDEIYDLRICLELHAGETAISRLTAGDLDRLRAQLDRIYHSALHGALEEQIAEDFAFHRLLLEISGNRRILRLYDDLASELSSGIALIGQLYDDPLRLARTHDPILAAIADRDTEGFRAAMGYHIGEARLAVVTLFRHRPAG